MITIPVTATERAEGQLTTAHLDKAVQTLRADGIVVLEDVVDLQHIETLQERMLEDLPRILARPDAPFNFNTGNVQQDPPPFPPYLFRDVLVNDLVIAVTRATIGTGVKNGYYSGNTALPGGTRQPVHPDVAQLWPDLEHATPAFGLVVNLPVVDMSAENGSTEVWPGTHLDTTYSIRNGSARVAEEHLARWRDQRPPVQPTVRAGSAVIRDIRLWHAGMPNHTQTPRPMIAMIHWAGWWNEDGKIAFPKGTEEFFKHPDLRTLATFVDGVPDYLNHNQAYDLQKGGM
jgi:hypothetical protein